MPQGRRGGMPAIDPRMRSAVVHFFLPEYEIVHRIAEHARQSRGADKAEAGVRPNTVLLRRCRPATRVAPGSGSSVRRKGAINSESCRISVRRMVYVVAEKSTVESVCDFASHCETNGRQRFLKGRDT